MLERLDSCRERHRTRDRLISYDPQFVVPMPHSAGLALPFPHENFETAMMTIIRPIPNTALSMVYPWEDVNMSILLSQLYAIALSGGFTGTISEFKTHFATFSGRRSILFANYNEFPEEGEQEKLYFDLEEKILYYWDEEYIPVNAMLIANTRLDGGEA